MTTEQAFFDALANLETLVLELIDAPVPGSPGLLTWSPPTLTNPVTLTRTTPGAVNLTAGQDYIIRLPNRIGGRLAIVGGRNVVIIGGHIYIPMQSGSPPSISSRNAMLLRGQTGTAHVEGVLMNGPDISEGVQIDAPNAIVQLQNLRIEDIHARDQVNFSDNHPDLVQPYGDMVELRIDRLTGSTDYQGFLFKADFNKPAGRYVIKNVNIKGLPTARYLFWFDSPAAGAGEIVLDNVWLDVPPQRAGGFGNAVWVKATATAPHRAIIETLNGRQIARWEGTTPTVAGHITEGTPPNGDYVPAGVAGLNYVSPGYVEA